MSQSPYLFDLIGAGYQKFRQPDARIEAMIVAALDNSENVLNVGAGAGSYEPHDRFVVAVEPSQKMIRQRPKAAAPVVQASAMALPLRDNTFDASMAILTIHHWPDRERGLAEMKRVTRNRRIVVTWEPPATEFWLTTDYLPHFLEADRLLLPPWFRRHPDTMDIWAIPIAHDCADGFLCAYWRRPEAYLDPDVRNAISTFSRVGNFDEGLTRLRDDLTDGTWHRRNAHLLTETAMDFGYRLVIMNAN